MKIHLIAATNRIDEISLLDKGLEKDFLGAIATPPSFPAFRKESTDFGMQCTHPLRILSGVKYLVNRRLFGTCRMYEFGNFSVTFV